MSTIMRTLRNLRSIGLKVWRNLRAIVALDIANSFPGLRPPDAGMHFRMRPLRDETLTNTDVRDVEHRYDLRRKLGRKGRELRSYRRHQARYFDWHGQIWQQVL